MRVKQIFDWKLRGLFIGTASLLLVGHGCSLVERQEMTPEAPTGVASQQVAPTSRQVRFGGDGLALGEADEPALKPDQLAEVVGGLLQAGKRATAARLVHRYPDSTWELLSNATSRQCRLPTYQFMAAAHDKQCSRGDPGTGWHALVADRAAHEQRYAVYEDKRRQFLECLHNGRAHQAMLLNITSIPQDAPGKLLEVDAWHLQGLAMLLDNRPLEAAAAFDRAAGLAWDAHPYQGVRSMVLLSEAKRRGGDPQGAATCWQSAASRAAELASARPAGVDPLLGERIAYLRPVDMHWPPAMNPGLHQLAAQCGMAFPSAAEIVPVSTVFHGAGLARTEMLIWTCIGHWRLARGQAQAALVALKRAEASASKHEDVGRLQLTQAKALSALQQKGAATASLVRLAGHTDPAVSQAAKALLGTLKLQEGSTLQGFNLLRDAVEKNQATCWPERPEAEADLGLAYLLVGDQQSGLRWLHVAQQKFEAAGDVEQLVQCLENEWEYFQQQEKKNEAKSIRRRLETLDGAA